jgi:hypothetical protein
MGYRSDVAIKIYGNKEKVQKVKDFADAELIKLDDEQQGFIKDLINQSEEYLDRSLWEDDEDEDEASFFFFAQWVKWYEGYPDVDYFDAIFKKAKEIGKKEDTETTDDDDSILYGEYVRIGEDMDDNEEDRFNTGMDDQVTIRRSIEY